MFLIEFWYLKREKLLSLSDSDSARLRKLLKQRWNEVEEIKQTITMKIFKVLWAADDDGNLIWIR